MRHRFNSSYSCLTCRHEHVEKPYLWREWTFTRRSSKTRLAQVLQYLVDHPGATRRQLHEAVFKQKFNPGQHSNFYSNALWHDFIDYDKHFKYVATAKGLEFLRDAYANDLAKLFKTTASSVRTVFGA